MSRKRVKSTTGSDVQILPRFDERSIQAAVALQNEEPRQWTIDQVHAFVINRDASLKEAAETLRYHIRRGKVFSLNLMSSKAEDEDIGREPSQNSNDSVSNKSEPYNDKELDHQAIVSFEKESNNQSATSAESNPDIESASQNGAEPGEQSATLTKGHSNIQSATFKEPKPENESVISSRAEPDSKIATPFKENPNNELTISIEKESNNQSATSAESNPDIESASQNGTEPGEQSAILTEKDFKILSTTSTESKPDIESATTTESQAIDQSNVSSEQKNESVSSSIIKHEEEVEDDCTDTNDWTLIQLDPSINQFLPPGTSINIMLTQEDLACAFEGLTLVDNDQTQPSLAPSNPHSLSNTQRVNICSELALLLSRSEEAIGRHLAKGEWPKLTERVMTSFYRDTAVLKALLEIGLVSSTHELLVTDNDDLHPVSRICRAVIGECITALVTVEQEAARYSSDFAYFALLTQNWPKLVIFHWFIYSPTSTMDELQITQNYSLHKSEASQCQFGPEFDLIRQLADHDLAWLCRTNQQAQDAILTIILAGQDYTAFSDTKTYQVMMTGFSRLKNAVPNSSQHDQIAFSVLHMASKIGLVTRLVFRRLIELGEASDFGGASIRQDAAYQVLLKLLPHNRLDSCEQFPTFDYIGDTKSFTTGESDRQTCAVCGCSQDISFAHAVIYCSLCLRFYERQQSLAIVKGQLDLECLSSAATETSSSVQRCRIACDQGDNCRKCWLEACELAGFAKLGQGTSSRQQTTSPSSPPVEQLHEQLFPYQTTSDHVTQVECTYNQELHPIIQLCACAREQLGSIGRWVYEKFKRQWDQKLLLPCIVKAWPRLFVFGLAVESLKVKEGILLPNGALIDIHSAESVGFQLQFIHFYERLVLLLDKSRVSSASIDFIRALLLVEDQVSNNKHFDSGLMVSRELLRICANVCSQLTRKEPVNDNNLFANIKSLCDTLALDFYVTLNFQVHDNLHLTLSSSVQFVLDAFKQLSDVVNPETSRASLFGPPNVSSIASQSATNGNCNYGAAGNNAAGGSKKGRSTELNALLAAIGEEPCEKKNEKTKKRKGRVKQIRFTPSSSSSPSTLLPPPGLKPLKRRGTPMMTSGQLLMDAVFGRGVKGGGEMSESMKEKIDWLTRQIQQLKQQSDVDGGELVGEILIKSFNLSKEEWDDWFRKGS